MNTDIIVLTLIVGIAIFGTALAILIVMFNHHLDRIGTNLRRIEWEIDLVMRKVKGRQDAIARLEEYFEQHHYSEFERKEILDYINKGGPTNACGI